MIKQKGTQLFCMHNILFVFVWHTMDRTGTLKWPDVAG